MDSKNNVKNLKNVKEIDIRDVVGYLFSKIWIISLVVALSIITAFLITSFTTELYTSTNKALLINKNEQLEGSTSEKLNASDLSIAIQLTIMSSEIFTSDSFAVRVAEMLNTDDGKFTNILGYKDENHEIPFVFKDYYGDNIHFSDVKSSIKIKSNESTCAVTLSATTQDPRLSALIATAAYECMQEHINENFKVESIIVGQVDYGKIPTSPSNIHYAKNMLAGAIIGAALVCAILLSFYVFDDKIKTPDDIEKHLGLSVLGEIPEIEEEA